MVALSWRQKTDVSKEQMVEKERLGVRIAGGKE